MYRVGLTGGIGSGKSEVARCFSDEGAFVIDADLSARAVVAPGTVGFAAIAARWPQVVIGDAIDRAALAEIVFKDKAERNELNAIVHPLVRALGAEIELTASVGQLVVHVVPLLFETNFAKHCQATVVVVAPLKKRIERVMARDRLSEEAIRQRILAQTDPNEAMRVATFVIRNDSDLNALRAAGHYTYQRLLARAHPFGI